MDVRDVYFPRQKALEINKNRNKNKNTKATLLRMSNFFFFCPRLGRVFRETQSSVATENEYDILIIVDIIIIIIICIRSSLTAGWGSFHHVSIFFFEYALNNTNPSDPSYIYTLLGIVRVLLCSVFSVYSIALLYQLMYYPCHIEHVHIHIFYFYFKTLRKIFTIHRKSTDLVIIIHLWNTFFFVVGVVFFNINLYRIIEKRNLRPIHIRII